jgi:hypothetical protein
LIRRNLQAIARLLPLSRRARFAAWVLPPRYWYRFALFASKTQGKLTTFAGGNGTLTEALMLDNWIRALTFSGAYPIPWVPGDVDILSAPRHPGGILYFWTHLPLVEMPLRAFLDMGHTLDVIVADPGKIVDGDEFVVPGLKMRVKALSADRRVLIKVRSALAQGKSVACLADAEIFGPLSSLVLQVAGKVGAFVIFQWAERQPNGTIKVNFIPAPHPLCKNAEEIAQNLEFLRVHNRTTLQQLNALHTRPDI